MVGAGLERDIGNGAFDWVTFKLRILQRNDFRMRATCDLGVAFAQHRASWRTNQAANYRVGRWRKPPSSRELKRSLNQNEKSLWLKVCTKSRGTACKGD